MMQRRKCSGVSWKSKNSSIRNTHPFGSEPSNLGTFIIIDCNTSERSGTESEKLAAVSKLHPDVIFFQTTRADVAKMFLIDPEIKRPALVLLEKESKQLSHFDGPFTDARIYDFISLNKIPPMITYTRETAALILDSHLQELWLFVTVHDSETKSIFQEAAKAFKGKVNIEIFSVYFQMDLLQTDRRQIFGYFGITGHASRVIAVNGFFNGEKYVLNGELTLSNIKSFALDFLEDKLRSQQSDTTLL
ncbi:hypothetical protein CICLE_v10033369mg [Citrus x clementina]|uniref:Thioredoxin-like fold domain-containing protein n=1 Tax=Citrus clementina TaxID=85681 RepID=V4VB79_CITCL|nr:hypothetical protein CICLE_v10033369mg [Citrus x clementina]